MQLASSDIAKLQATGATDGDIDTLLDALDLHVMDLNSDARPGGGDGGQRRITRPQASLRAVRLR